MKLLLLLLISSISYAQSNLCEKRADELRKQGKRNVQCKPTVDFGFRTKSADYNSSQTGPLAAPVGLIKDPSGKKVFQEQLKKDYGITNLYFLTETYRPPLTNPDALSDADKADAYGATALSVFANAISTAYTDKDTDYEFIVGDLTKALSPKKNHKAWEGQCLLFSAWNASSNPLDLEFKSLLGNMKRGVLCDGKWPLTRGVLKQLWTGLTIEPKHDFPGSPNDFQQLDLNQGKTYSEVEHPLNPPENIENANVAMMKLGDFGTSSDFAPNQILALAQNAKNKGESLIFDLNSGRPVWNQPIELVYELTYEDSSQSASDQTYYTAKDFQSSNPEGQDILAKIATLETILKVKASQDDQSPVNLCQLQQVLKVNCTYLPNPTFVSEQVNQLKALQQVALTNGSIKLTAPPVVHHQIIIQYGNEGEFGESADQVSPNRVLDYVEVNGRAIWTTPTKRLSAACSDGQFGMRGDKDSLLQNLKGACPVPAGKDREIFTGDLPPKNFKVLRPEPSDRLLSYVDQKKRNAQKKLLKLIHEHCPSFDAGAKFLDRLKLALSRNQITQTDIQELKILFPQAKSFLSANFVEESIAAILPPGTSAASVPGVTELKKTLGI